MSSVFDADRIEVPIETFLGDRTRRRFGERKHSIVLGIEDGRDRYVVKTATDEETSRLLRDAVAFHSHVAHPAIVPLLHRFETPEGLALVYPWADGEVLADAVDAAVPHRDDPSSPYRRLLALPVADRCNAVRELFDAHVAVAAAGFVAVDLYDGSVLYDFDRRRLRLIDLDMYRPGPYVLDRDRQFGSTTYLAPEEHQRGATIDERTMVFTLGRFGLVFLGGARDRPPTRSDFHGGDAHWAVLQAATRPEPDERIATVADLCSAWDAGVP